MLGSISVPVAKNSVLPILAASLMLDGESLVKNCPSLTDVATSVEIINTLGGRAVISNGNLSVSYDKSENNIIDTELCKRMRSSILYIAPLLYRNGTVTLCQPGGCNIGERRIDIHLEGLCQMGAMVENDAQNIKITAPKGLKGTQFKLRVPSVGATQTLMMAAATAKGITILYNCAREPEIVDLAGFLKSAGARITGAGRSEIIIQGVENLNGVEYTPVADRIFAATILSAVSACKGAVLMKNYPADYMGSFERMIGKSGCRVFHFGDKAIVVKAAEKVADVKISTGYYPAFATDMGPLAAAAMVNNNGTLEITEGVFENRFAYAQQFEKLGLCCKVEQNKYFQTAGKDVYSANLQAADLRAGAAVVVAALAKRGNFTIEGLEYIDRGYEEIENVFSALGADIRRDTF